MTEVYVPMALIDAVRAEKKSKQERIDKLDSECKKGFDSHVSILTTLVESKMITEKEAADRMVAFLKEQAELIQKAKNEVGPAVAKLTELVGRPSDHDDCI
tara:strand:+ start:60 stop:362 length:303 start_codon:yes stop_codon:yes gene_type:complete